MCRFCIIHVSTISQLGYLYISSSLVLWIARMMRRARCFHASQYSTDAGDNVRMLEEEKEQILAQRHFPFGKKPPVEGVAVTVIRRVVA